MKPIASFFHVASRASRAYYVYSTLTRLMIAMNMACEYYIDVALLSGFNYALMIYEHKSRIITGYLRGREMNQPAQSQDLVVFSGQFGSAFL